VIAEGGDLFGDGVNITARLQGLAEPGGILVSGPVFDQVKSKVPLGFYNLGPQSMKNIVERVPGQADRLLPLPAVDLAA
jgi:adenylate cyclase